MIDLKFEIELSCDTLMKWLEVESVTNDMIKVYQGLKDKGQVFFRVKSRHLKNYNGNT